MAADSISMSHEVTIPLSQSSNTATETSQSRSVLGITVSRDEMTFKHYPAKVSSESPLI